MSDDEQNQPSEDENPNSITGRRRRKPFTRMMDISDLSDQFMYETFETGADLSGDERMIQPSNPHARPEEPSAETSTSSGLSALLGDDDAKEEEENPQVTTFSSLLQATGEFQKPTKIAKAPAAPPPAPGSNVAPNTQYAAPAAPPGQAPPAPSVGGLGAMLGSPPAPAASRPPAAPSQPSSMPQPGAPAPFPAPAGPPQLGAPPSLFGASSPASNSAPPFPAAPMPQGASPMGVPPSMGAPANSQFAAPPAPFGAPPVPGPMAPAIFQAASASYTNMLAQGVPPESANTARPGSQPGPTTSHANMQAPGGPPRPATSHTNMPPGFPQSGPATSNTNMQAPQVPPAPHTNMPPGFPQSGPTTSNTNMQAPQVPPTPHTSMPPGFPRSGPTTSNANMQAPPSQTNMPQGFPQSGPTTSHTNVQPQQPQRPESGPSVAGAPLQSRPPGVLPAGFNAPSATPTPGGAPSSPAQPGSPMRFNAPVLDDSADSQSGSSVPESPFAPPKPIDPAGAAPVQQNAFSPPPLNSVPLMQVPNLASDQSLEDMILKAQPEEVPFGTNNTESARHRTVRRADFTRPRIPGLQTESARHAVQETPAPTKSKRSFGQKLRDFTKQLRSALNSLFKD